VIASATFWLARPIALKFMAREDFARRLKVWYVLTAVGFLSPNFWLYALIGIPIMVAAGRKDSNPTALYLMLLHVIPPISLPVPMIGVPYLFYIDNYLLLSFCIMAPAARRIMQSKNEQLLRGLHFTDVCLLAYGLLTAVLYVHTEIPGSGGAIYPGSVTESLRRAFVFFFAIYVPCFTISRGNFNRKVLLDTIATYCMICAVLALVAVFESARHWLLYGEIAGRWGSAVNGTPYLARGSSLRAMASSGHSMALGHLLAIAFGLSLYVQSRLQSTKQRLAVTVLFWAGLMAAYARGAWIGAVLAFFLFAMLRPNPFSKLFKAGMGAGIAAFAVFLSPLGDKITSVLPFLGGHVDSFNVLYRQRLWDRSWEVIQGSPVWGDQSAFLKMQDLRQGEGIIDLVNSYVQILLDNGFVGLSLILAFILIPLLRAWSQSRNFMRLDPDLSLLGAALVACVVVTLVLIENGSFVGVSEIMFYIIAALATAYVHISRSSQPLRQMHSAGLGANAASR
jgi:O-antigen ligase